MAARTTSTTVQTLLSERKRPELRYTVNAKQLSPLLQSRFEQSTCDDECKQFLSYAATLRPFRMLFASFLTTISFSRTSANALAGRGDMFVLSTQQARSLLRSSPDPRALLPEEPLSDEAVLLDLGAGDGGVTAKLAPLFHSVDVTECSRTMQWRLRRRGYTVRDHLTLFGPPPCTGAVEGGVRCKEHDKADSDTEGDVRRAAHTPAEGRRYDVIACLNLLDRIDTPLTLLHQMRDALKPGGLLLLAVVLPWCPTVECGGGRWKPASEQLPMTGGECRTGATFEQSLSCLVENVLLPCGYDLVRWTRLPYLCEGNMYMEYAMLNDAVLVLKPRTHDDASLHEAPSS